MRAALPHAADLSAMLPYMPFMKIASTLVEARPARRCQCGKCGLRGICRAHAATSFPPRRKPTPGGLPRSRSSAQGRRISLQCRLRGGEEDIRTFGTLLNDLNGDVSVSYTGSMSSENLKTAPLPRSRAKQCGWMIPFKGEWLASLWLEVVTLECCSRAEDPLRRR